MSLMNRVMERFESAMFYLCDKFDGRVNWCWPFVVDGGPAVVACLGSISLGEQQA